MNARRFLLTSAVGVLLAGTARAADPDEPTPEPVAADTADTATPDDDVPLVLAPTPSDEVDACARVAANTKAPMYACAPTAP